MSKLSPIPHNECRDGFWLAVCWDKDGIQVVERKNGQTFNNGNPAYEAPKELEESDGN